MYNFIEDYLKNPSQAVSSAVRKINESAGLENIDPEDIYSEIASPQFRLYEEIIFCPSADDLHVADSIRPVA